MMRFMISMLYFLVIASSAIAQNPEMKWYSTSDHNGIIIQNSFPRGGRYTEATKNHYNHSYLVFFSRIINQTEKSFDLKIDFPTDSIGIPNSPETFVKLFLPPDKMTMEKQDLFNYGLSDFTISDQSTTFQKTVDPNEECLFYVLAIFYQTTDDAKDQSKGGNRAELFLEGQDLFYRMLPQIDSMHCGYIALRK